MAIPALESAPVLSTPDTRLFEDGPAPALATSGLARLSDEQLALTYEIRRTVQEIRAGRWKRIALQFPDHMLVDAPRVSGQLSEELGRASKAQSTTPGPNSPGTDTGPSTTSARATLPEKREGQEQEKVFILGDTSYGACCVDEVAAEHVDADVVVHYGRSCLSPPSRLPVIYVFTERPLDLDAVTSTFQQTYPDRHSKVILMADIPYSIHLPILYARLQDEGYINVFATKIVHNPSSVLPNRTLPDDAPVAETQDALLDYALFHISDPPTALLLTLSSRVASIHIYPTATTTATTPTASLANTARALRRRYALLTSLSTTPIFGILINTLSVKNYMHILAHVQQQIAAAGKKSYTFVVGKVNAAKVANFSEVGGWVVIGCWESSLIDSTDFWRPIITPWELALALQPDAQRVWTGQWDSDFQAVLADRRTAASQTTGDDDDDDDENDEEDKEEEDEEEDSAPPEFDLRTGRYVSHSRPMRALPRRAKPDRPTTNSTALARRANGALASIGGEVSPGAEFLRSSRTWRGLGSSGRGEEEEGDGVRAARMEEGRSGIARGYVVGAGEGGRH